MSSGRKNILYKNKKYNINDIINYRKNNDLQHIFSDGEFRYITTGEELNINTIEKFKETLDEVAIEAVRETSSYEDSTQVKKKIIDKERMKQKIKELEDRFNDEEEEITLNELKELIDLKYGKSYKVYISYENFIKINHKIPDLTDGDLGKFYKILSKLTHKANTLLTKKDIRSNPLMKDELCELLNLKIKAVEQYLKRLKNKSVIKEVNICNKKHYMINPLYAFNGSLIGSYTYLNFKEEIESLTEIPNEIKALWDYEFLNSNIQD